MKRILLNTLVFLYWTGMGYAQSVDFPSNEAVWKEIHITIAGPFSVYYALCGDTVVDGRLYSQVLSLQVDSNQQITNTTYIGGLRSDGHQVFMRYDGLAETLLYDFSLLPGQQIEVELPYALDTVTMKVESVESQLIAGKMRRVIHFTQEDPFCPFPGETWIEGIGSNYGLLMRGFNLCNVADAGAEMQCFEHGDEMWSIWGAICDLPELTGCDFSNATKDRDNHILSLQFFPNPATEWVRIKDTTLVLLQSATVHLFDARGQLVFRGPYKENIPVDGLASGMYFVLIRDQKWVDVAAGRFLKL